jgi:hypothetical protein
VESPPPPPPRRPLTNLGSPRPGRAGSAHIRRARDGNGKAGGMESGLQAKKPGPPQTLSPGVRTPMGTDRPGLQQEAEPASSIFPAVRVSGPARPHVRVLCSQGTPGDFGATHTPRSAPPPARPHVSGCNLRKFFPFLFFSFFFFKLSLLSLLGATWWCAGGVSLPPRSPPLSLPLLSLPPLSLPPQWMEAGRLRARSPLTTYGMTSERENVPRPGGSSPSPRWNQIHIWSHGLGPGAHGWFQLCEAGIGKNEPGRGEA